MALYQGSNPISSQINIEQYADVTELMKHMTVELGDIGQVLLPLNENENKRRYLNGQAILQEQFPRFTAKLKAAVALYPSLACTEQQWQAKRLADPDDQCAKFVIDDVSGLIRLPRVKYLVGNLNLYHLCDGIPHRRLVKTYKNGTQWYNWYSDGWCEQGGNVNAATYGGTVNTVTLMVPYLDTTYSLTGVKCSVADTGSVALNLPASSKTTTSFNWSVAYSSNLTRELCWRAEGYANKPNQNVQYNDKESQFESPYFIQVSTGVDYEVDVTNTLSVNSPYSLGMYTRSIGNLNNASWLKSDGSYYPGTAYTDYYNWILQNYTGARNDGIEVGIKDLNYRWYQNTNTDFKIWTPKRNPQIGDPVYGYQVNHVAGYITTITDENTITYFNVRTQSDVTLIYEGTDTNNFCLLDYMYVLDTANQTFRLPLLVGDEMAPTYSAGVTLGFDSVVRDTSKHYYIAPSNGIAWIQIDRDGGSGDTPHVYVNGVLISYEPYWVANATGWCIPLRRGDLLRCWCSRAGNEFNYGVQTFFKSTNTTNSLYFYAGETLQDANLINIGRIVENIADIDTLAQMGSQLSALTTRYIVEKWESGNQFRILYNDGWCEQGGEVYLSGEVNVTVTYNVPYVDNNYNLTLGWNSVLSGESVNNDTSNGSDKKATGFVVYGKTAAGYMSWRACGYVATT